MSASQNWIVLILNSQVWRIQGPKYPATRNIRIHRFPVRITGLRIWHLGSVDLYTKIHSQAADYTAQHLSENNGVQSVSTRQYRLVFCIWIEHEFRQVHRRPRDPVFGHGPRTNTWLDFDHERSRITVFRARLQLY